MKACVLIGITLLTVVACSQDPPPPTPTSTALPLEIESPTPISTTTPISVVDLAVEECREEFKKVNPVFHNFTSARCFGALFERFKDEDLSLADQLKIVDLRLELLEVRYEDHTRFHN